MKLLRLALCSLVLCSLASAQTPPPVTEASCAGTDAARRGLAGGYTCQVSIDGTWHAPYACELTSGPRSTAKVRKPATDVPCWLHGTVTRRAFDGFVLCKSSRADVSGEQAELRGTFSHVAGGYRLARTRVRYLSWRVAQDEQLPGYSTRTAAVTIKLCRA